MANVKSLSVRCTIAAILGSLPGFGLAWITGSISLLPVAICGAVVGVVSTIAGMSPALVLRTAVALVVSNAVPPFMSEQAHDAVMNDDPAKADEEPASQTAQVAPVAHERELA